MTNPTYTFTLDKYFEYEDKVQVHIITEGQFNVSTTKNEEIGITEIHFDTENFKQKGVKESLVFTPFKWLYDFRKKTANIKGKSNLEAHWKRYRDKHRSKENQAHFLVFERLFFNTPTGLENYYYSNSFHLPFFINIDSGINKNDVIKGLDWLLIPMSIPVNTYYKCIDITSEIIKLEGWITLDKEKLAEYLSLKKFQAKAKEYHFSEDFIIDSKISVNISRDFNLLVSADFELEIKGDELLEKFSYRITGNKLEINKPNSSYIVGRPQFIDGRR